MNPFDYSLCDQTVTIYRKDGDEITRQVMEKTYLSAKTSTPTESYGKSMEKEFLLIIPGDFCLQPGDRVFDGIGPEEINWNAFVPAAIPKLFTVSFAYPCCWEGEIAHWEAGHR